MPARVGGLNYSSALRNQITRNWYVREIQFLLEHIFRIFYLRSLELVSGEYKVYHYAISYRKQKVFYVQSFCVRNSLICVFRYVIIESLKSSPQFLMPQYKKWSRLSKYWRFYSNSNSKNECFHSVKVGQTSKQLCIYENQQR